MAARIYSQFPEKRLTHDSGKPKAGTPLKGPTGVTPGPAWPKGELGTPPWAGHGGEKPKQSGGTFHLP